MKKFLIEFTVLYIAALIIGAIISGIAGITGCDITAGDVFLYSLIMPVLVCGSFALEGAYNDDAEDDSSILF